MLKINGIELRNLEEQVQKNKEDIAAHYNIDRVLADFGIRIIGQVDSADDLPEPSTFEGEYGDAYAVGVSDPYSFYIWTRADLNAGHPNDYWFDIGPLAIVGPQGPQGEKGDKGDRGPVGTQIYAFAQLPTLPNPLFKQGDLVVNADGYIYKATQYNYWVNTGVSIKGPAGMNGATGATGAQGPQGPQGEKGETGDPGAFIRINGILSTTDQLPMPESLNDPSLAYLIGSSNNLWIQIRDDETGEYYWNDIGPINVATYITSGGQFQNIWNADTKLAAPGSVNSYETIPVIKRGTYGSAPSDMYYTTMGSGPSGAGEIVTRNSDSQLLNDLTGNTSNNQYACVNIGYAKSNFMAVPQVSKPMILGAGANKQQLQIPIQTTSSSTSPTIQADENMVPRYVNKNVNTNILGLGALPCTTPTKDYHAANKKYVDESIPTGSADAINIGNTLPDAILMTDFGQTFLHGKSVKLTFTANGSIQNITADNHIVIIYRTGADTKILVLSLQTLGVSGYNGTLQSNIEVYNGSNQYSTQMIKLPTKFN